MRDNIDPFSYFMEIVLLCQSSASDVAAYYLLPTGAITGRHRGCACGWRSGGEQWAIREGVYPGNLFIDLDVRKPDQRPYIDNIK